MTQSNFGDVGDFHHKFDLHAADGNEGPTGFEANEELMAFRVKFMQEELNEFKEGLGEQDMSKMADALVDLAYVVFGTAHFLGLPWQELWDDVHAANMNKIRAASDGSDSKRGTGWDVVKPEGWVPPKTADILDDWGYNTSSIKDEDEEL